MDCCFEGLSLFFLGLFSCWFCWYWFVLLMVGVWMLLTLGLRLGVILRCCLGFVYCYVCGFVVLALIVLVLAGLVGGLGFIVLVLDLVGEFVLFVWVCCL